MSIIIFGVAAVAVLSALAFPDPPVPQPITPVSAVAAGVQSTETQTQANPTEASPFALARSINNVKRTGKDLSLSETWQKLGVEAGSFAECGSDCEAKIYRHELSSNRGPEVVIKLTRFPDLCRYLVFGRNESAWKFLGHVDHDFNKYEMASHRIGLVKGKPFLVIRGQEGSGSGFALYAESWYDVNGDTMKRVLFYPSDGHTNPWPAGLARSFKAGSPPRAARPDRLMIQYATSYETEGYEGIEVRLKFSNQHRAAYQWDNQSRKFVLDPQQSNISEAEINAIANIESEAAPKGGTKISETTFYSAAEAGSFIGGGYEVFLKHNLPRLKAIAQGRPTKAREWLQRFLTECRDTEEKKTLMAALGK